MRTLPRSIWIGLHRHWWLLLKNAFVCYGVLWTLANSATCFFWKDLPLCGIWAYIIMLAVSLGVGAWTARQERDIVIKTKFFDTSIRVLFGDVFAQDGLIAVSVNEFFDSLIGDHVALKSLHGAVIDQFFVGHSEVFDKCVDQDLQGVSGEEVQRPSGRTRRYPIGTTALVLAGGKRFLCVALTKTDLKTLKASADTSQLWAAMTGLLQKARIAANGQNLSIPLMGSGLAKTGISPSHIVQLMILAISQESKKEKVCNEIRIVLHEDQFEEIDLRTIETCWR